MRLVLLTVLLYGCMSIGGVARAMHESNLSLPTCQPDNWGWLVAATFEDQVIFYLTEEKIRKGVAFDPKKIFCILGPENPVLIMPPSKFVNVPKTFNQRPAMSVSRLMGK